jgi:hypothetical protein
MTIVEFQADASERLADVERTVSRSRITIDRTRFIVSYTRARLDRPRPAFSGGDGSRPDGAAVRERVRQLIDRGVLPGFSSGRLAAGPCLVAHDCTVCGGAIRVGEKEVEIVSRTGAAVIYLHRACFEMWGEEASDGDSPPATTRCALCRTMIAATSPRRVVDGQTYHAGCWDRQVRETQKKS